MPFFSIIVPVYQAKDYLLRCVHSVLLQDFQDFELLLIDDGSSEGSSGMCDVLEKEDNRVKSFHKMNGGAATARNFGVKRSQGQYLLFLDSDDYWEGTDFLSQLNDILRENCDICFYGCYDEFADTGERVKSRGDYEESVFKGGNKNEILYRLYLDGQFPGACWILCVRKALLAENDICFIEGNRAEDIDWLLNVMSVAKTFAYLNVCGYIYIKNRSDSITGTAGLESIYSILTTVKKWTPKLKAEQTGKIYLALNTYLVFTFLTAVMLYDKLNREEKKQVKRMFQGIVLDLNNLIGKKMILCGKLYQIFGVTVASKLLNIARNRKK